MSLGPAKSNHGQLLLLLTAEYRLSRKPLVIIIVVVVRPQKVNPIRLTTLYLRSYFIARDIRGKLI